MTSHAPSQVSNDPRRTAPPVLEARGISKTFDHVEPLRGTSLTAGRSAIVGLVAR